MDLIRKIIELPSDSAFSRTMFVLLVIGLTLFGFVMIYSASAPSAVAEGIPVTSYLFDQLKFASIGAVAAVAAWRLPYRTWSTWIVYAVWGIGLALVCLTVVMGAAKYGAQRWLVLGPISLQPSEFMKIALVMVAAKILSDLRAGVRNGREALVMAMVLIVIPVAFIYLTQSDLGTTMIIGIGIISVMWLGEVPTRWIAGILGLLFFFAVVSTLTTTYRSNRLLFLDPWNDGENGYGNGYQIIHSYYAFAEGGIFGVGIGNSAEKYLYLPESETDFIYSIIGEELGMVGALIIVVAFIVLMRCGMVIAKNANDDFGRMLAGALTIMIVFQAFLNMGSAVGVAPTTGKPLPFVSSGGSSLIATFIMVGLILSVGREQGGHATSIGNQFDMYERRRDNLRVVRAVDGNDSRMGSGRYSSNRDSSSFGSRRGSSSGRSRRR